MRERLQFPALLSHPGLNVRMALGSSLSCMGERRPLREGKRGIDGAGGMSHLALACRHWARPPWTDGREPYPNTALEGGGAASTVPGAVTVIPPPALGSAGVNPTALFVVE